MAKKRYSKKITKKKIFRISPKEAETLFKQEIIDSHGNKTINRIRFKPQNPLKPDFIQTIEYKDNVNDRNN